jgi:hypothetical protein
MIKKKKKNIKTYYLENELNYKQINKKKIKLEILIIY